MAPTFQASKFALLPDDDEDLNKKALRALKNGKTDTKVDNAKTKSKAKKKNKKKNSEATPPPDPSNGDSNKNEKKAQPETSSINEQFSTWLSHDKQVNDEAFAQDLQNAILASKIEHVAESKKSQNGPPGMSKQTKKSATMTLQDFNNLSLNQDANSQPNSNLQTAVTETETFFEDVEEATKKALNREQIKESLEQRYNVSWQYVFFKKGQISKFGASKNYFCRQRLGNVLTSKSILHKSIVFLHFFSCFETPKFLNCLL